MSTPIQNPKRFGIVPRPPVEAFLDNRVHEAFLKLYKEMWFEVREVALVWHYLRHGKELRSTRSDEDLEEVMSETRLLIERIESTRLLDHRWESDLEEKLLQFATPFEECRITLSGLQEGDFG